jgi:hypothetical protein
VDDQIRPSKIKAEQVNWDLLSEKLAEMEQTLIIETTPDRRFELQHKMDLS